MLLFASSLLPLSLETILKTVKAKKMQGTETKGGENKQHVIAWPDFQNTVSLHLVGVSLTSSPAYYRTMVPFSSSEYQVPSRSTWISHQALFVCRIPLSHSPPNIVKS